MKYLNNSLQNIKPIIFTLLFVIASFGIVGTVQAQKLNSAELKSAISGKKFTYSGKYFGTQKYSANGKVSYNDKTGYKDTGKWWIKNNKICIKFKKSKKSKCRSWTLQSNGSYKSTSGYVFTPN